MSRRQGRYIRRQYQRRCRRYAVSQKIGSLADVFTYNNLYRAGKDCCKGVRWKHSTQNFEMNLFSGTARRRKQVIDRTWEPSSYYHFTLSERGKVRPIDAPKIQDRQVHKVYSQDVLLPSYLPSMIYNNGASLQGKGFDFSVRELKEDLRSHFRKYGTDGFVILLDFKQFFPSASHKVLYARHKLYLLDDYIRDVGDKIIRSFPGERGIPLGVEPSQMEMVAYPSALDNYIKCQLGIRGAGHYMDDYYILVSPKRSPKDILRFVEQKATSIELTLNRSKSKIIPISKPFKYCKIKYWLTKTGAVVTRGCRDSMVRARRKFRAFHRLVETGQMKWQYLWTSVNGIIAYFSKFNDHNRILKLRRLFHSLFGFSATDMQMFKEKLPA